MQRLAPRPGAAPWLLAAGTALLLCGPHAARAQSLDTDGLEQLFGEPITTSATGKPQRASEVAANMEIITADDIRRSGADNSTLAISPVREVRPCGRI